MLESKNIIDPQTETLDDLLIGGMRLIQPKKGYRFSIDAVLLAYFPQLSEVKKAVDLGTGHAVIPHLLSYRNPGLIISGVEIQTQMLDRAERSIIYNHLQQRIKLIKADIREIHQIIPGCSTQLVTCNPPFWKKGSGIISANHEKAAARHEVLITLEEIIAAAKYILMPGGRICIIHTENRFEEVLHLFAAYKITISRIRFIHSRINERAKLFLLEGVKDESAAIEIMAPLVIYDEKDSYSMEIKKIYNLL